MGYLKNLMIEWEERGYGPIEASVCPRHVHDQFLIDRISEMGNESCTYCGRSGAAPLEAVMVFVKSAIDEHYVSAISHLSWEHYVRAPDGEEVLLDVAGDDFDEEVFNDIVAALSHNDDRWTPLSEDGSLGDTWLTAGWARFRRWVMTRSRFLLEPPSEEDHEFGQPPQEMLSEIGDLILREDLFKTLDPGTAIFRARVLGDDVAEVDARDMSAPPPELAIAGRMNPRGISFFYGALDPETATFEAYDGSRQAIVAEFRTLDRLMVVDLTRLPPLPSIYDVERSERFRKLLFLADFARDIARPIDRDDKRDLEYLPSQAVIEYLHLGLPPVASTPIHGVLFRSSRVGGSNYGYPDSVPNSGINVTLFCGFEAALTNEQLFEQTESDLQIRSEQQLLEINPDSISVYEFGPPKGELRHRVQLRAPSPPGSHRDPSPGGNR